MEDKTKADLTNRLKVAEDYVEKIKAELYAAIGKVSLLKENRDIIRSKELKEFIGFTFQLV